MRNIQTDPLHCPWCHNETRRIYLLIIFLVRKDHVYLKCGERCEDINEHHSYNTQ